MVKVRGMKAVVLNNYTLLLVFKMENNCPGSHPRPLQGDAVDKLSHKRRGPLFFKPPEKASFVLSPKNLRLINLLGFYFKI